MKMFFAGLLTSPTLIMIGVVILYFYMRWIGRHARRDGGQASCDGPDGYHVRVVGRVVADQPLKQASRRR
jgi:uncharacterized membrane protein